MFKTSLFVLLIVFTMSFYHHSIVAQKLPSSSPGVSRELARWRAEHYRDVRYKLNLTLEKNAPQLKGNIEIRVVLADKANQIILDWRKIRGKEQFTNVSNILVNDKPAKFEEVSEHLVFSENIKAGENIVKLDFASPIATSGAAITRYVDKEDGAEYIYSLFVPSDASTAFPCFDQPDLKARFNLSITLPKKIEFWTVVSNSQKKTQFWGAEGTRIQFKETELISTYVFAFAAGDFVEISETSVNDVLIHEFLDKGASTTYKERNKDTRIYVRKSQVEKFKQHEREFFRLNREAVQFLESYFDFKFPFQKYDLVLLPEFPFGGMEHAGATFLREDRVIFPQEPIANDFITRGNLIFHEAAHQWFGDTVTMRWFDDLWLKEGFAEFMAYKAMEKVLPQYNAWKAFYERNKPLAYQTDSTRGTTPIYQEIPNLSAAKSAYGNIVYRKAPSFLKQAEFYLGADKFQIAVRQFLKQNAFKNAEWQDLVKSFEIATGRDLKIWANTWVKKRGLPIFRVIRRETFDKAEVKITSNDILNEGGKWQMKVISLMKTDLGKTPIPALLEDNGVGSITHEVSDGIAKLDYFFLNHQDYGYGIFLLDEQSRNYILANLQNEKDAFLRAMLWGALWDSVREAELNPKDYVELAVKNIANENDELTIQTILGRVGTAMNYYLSPAEQTELAPRLEKVLIERLTNAETLGQRIVFYRAFINSASTENSRQTLKDILNSKFQIPSFKLKTKDKFDIAARLLILNDADAPKILEDLIKIETSDEAKRFAYAARAGTSVAESKQQYFEDFLSNKEISESWIEAAIVPFNAARQADQTLPFLERALSELPNLKRNRKIFFINNWLAAFISGQRDREALQIVNKFLSGNSDLDRDLRLKVLENVDALERTVKIRAKFAN